VDQEHVVKTCGPLANLPLVVSKFIDGKFLWLSLKEQCSEFFIRAQTYSHRIEVLSDLLSNLVGELAACYWQATPSPAQCINLPTWWSTCGCGTGLVDISDTTCHCLDTRETWDGVNSSDLVEDNNKCTNNQHKMTPGASISTRSSQPSRPVNVLRSASPIFIPGRPTTLKEIGSNHLKFHCFLL
jgi:hypothetical protein